jgi:hypothetical protein
VLLGKSVGMLYSPLLKQSTLTPFEVLVQPQTLGHDDATPTSRILSMLAYGFLNPMEYCPIYSVDSDKAEAL